MAEKYGINARVIEADAQSPVTSASCIVYLAKSSSTKLDSGKPYFFNTYSDYLDSAFDGSEPASMSTLDMAAKVALEHVQGVWVVNTESPETVIDAALTTICMTTSDIPNIVVCPGLSDKTKLDTICGICDGKIAGKYHAQVFYDIAQSANQLSNGKPVADKIKPSCIKGNAVACWGTVAQEGESRVNLTWTATSSGDDGDPTYEIQSSTPALKVGDHVVKECKLTATQEIFTLEGTVYMSGSKLKVDMYKTGTSETVSITKYIAQASWIVSDSTKYEASIAISALRAEQDAKNTQNVPYRSVGNQRVSMAGLLCNSSAVTCREDYMNSVAENGVVSFVNRGSNQWYTWGDHSAAVSAGAIDDETYRFDSTVAVIYHLANRFIKKWQSSIDKPMTLRLRDCIIAEEQDYLNGLKAIGCLVGDPKCEFRALDNTSDTIGAGQFYFTNIATIVPPAKYIDLAVQYTDSGLSAYLEV